jgi:membrane-bound lytic murein transglycosylase B
VLEKAAYQPEFTTKIWDYVDSRVNPYTVKIGRKMAAKHASTLNAIERHFGVDKTILLAIWSMESNYGAVLDKDDRCTTCRARWQRLPMPTSAAPNSPRSS